MAIVENFPFQWTRGRRGGEEGRWEGKTGGVERGGFNQDV